MLQCHIFSTLFRHASIEFACAFKLLSKCFALTEILLNILFVTCGINVMAVKYVFGNMHNVRFIQRNIYTEYKNKTEYLVLEPITFIQHQYYILITDSLSNLDFNLVLREHLLRYSPNSQPMTSFDPSRDFIYLFRAQGINLDSCSHSSFDEKCPARNESPNPS